MYIINCYFLCSFWEQFKPVFPLIGAKRISEGLDHYLKLTVKNQKNIKALKSLLANPTKIQQVGELKDKVIDIEKMEKHLQTLLTEQETIVPIYNALQQLAKLMEIAPKSEKKAKRRKESKKERKRCFIDQNLFGYKNKHIKASISYEKAFSPC